MSTRAAIARPKPGGGWIGRYHHWDGYPCGLGQALVKLYREHFYYDVAGMMAVLVEQHPAGWSTIVNKDWSLTPGYRDTLRDHRTAEQTLGPCPDVLADEPGYIAWMERYRARPQPPQCFCHGERAEGPQDVSEANASGCGCEYAYVLLVEEGRDVMYVLTSLCDPVGEFAGQKMVGAFGFGDENGVWVPAVKVALAGPPLDWDRLDQYVREIECPQEVLHWAHELYPAGAEEARDSE